MWAVPAGTHSQSTDTTQRIWHSPNMWCQSSLRAPSAWCAITAHQTHSTDGQIRAWNAGLEQTQPLLSCLTGSAVWVTHSQIKHRWNDRVAAKPELCQIPSEHCAEWKPNRLHSTQRFNAQCSCALVSHQASTWVIRTDVSPQQVQASLQLFFFLNKLHHTPFHLS